jgi:galactokinase
MIPEFRERFGDAHNVRIVRAPGRVNLIGEHTDYNLGFVLPIALDLACYIAYAPASDGHLHAYSEEEGEGRDWAVTEIPSLTPAGDWTDYVIGVARQLLDRGFEIQPANLLIRSTVPEGSGLSSSAALEVSSALALLGGRSIDGVELAKLCQRAEIEFVGMPCGIMDQYISVFGQPRAAIELDCRSLTHQLVPLPDNVEIYAVNSMVKHELAQTAYRERTEECAMAVDALHREFPEIESLRDATMRHLEMVELPAKIARRARHVVTEIGRVGLFVNAAARRDVERIGELFVESHRSLQHAYEVSSDELDFLVDVAIGIDGVYGARMTGGGFGGCTVNLLRPGGADRFQSEVVSAYRERFRLVPQIFRCVPSGGAGEEKNLENIPAVDQLAK